MVKTLLKSVREYKKATILTPFFVALEVVMEVLLPFVMALLIAINLEAFILSTFFDMTKEKPFSK